MIMLGVQYEFYAYKHMQAEGTDIVTQQNHDYHSSL